MIPKTNLAGSYVLIVICLSSCAPSSNRYIFRDSSANLPGLTEKGEYVVSGRYATSGIAQGDAQSDAYGPTLNGYDLEGAYALSSQWSVLAGFSGRMGQYNGVGNAFYPFDSSYQGYKSYAWQLGVAWMLHIHKHFYFAPSMGMGGGVFGITDREFDSSGATASSAYYFNTRQFQGYIQPAFYIKGNWASFAFGWRFSFNQFTHVSTNYAPADQSNLSIDGLQGATLNTCQVFVLFRACPWTKSVRLEFQAGLGNGLSSNMQYYNWYGINVSTGISIDPYQFIKEKRRKKTPPTF